MSKFQNREATPNEITFVKDQLLNGRQPRYIKWVTKKKRDKVQDRLIVVGDYRVFSIKKKLTGGKAIRRVGHFFDLVEIFSPDTDKCVLKFRDFEIDITATTAGIELIGIIRAAFQEISCSFAEYAMPKIVLLPSERVLQQLPNSDTGPAYGLLATYGAFCDYYKSPPSQDFIKYVSDLSTQGTHEIIMDQCPGIERKENPIDFIPIRAAFRHNTWFNSFVLRNVLRKELSLCMADTLMHNVTLEKLVLSGVDMQADAAVALGNALKRNPHNRLVEVDISFNPKIGEKGAVGFADGLQSLTHSISKLNISGCQFSPKATSQIFQAMCLGKDVSWGLVELDMAHNSFSQAGSVQLNNWFLQGGKSLRTLLLSNAKVDVGLVMKAIKQNGDVKFLQDLDLSNNKIDAIGAQSIAAAIEVLPALTNLNVSNCSMSAQHAIPILSALATNSFIKSVNVNISFNELGPAGASSIAQIIANANNITALIAKGCEFKKEGLQKIADALVQNSSLKIFDLALNFSTGNEAKMKKLMQTFAASVARHPSLEYFSMAGDGNKKVIGKELDLFLKMITEDPKLMELDVSGNKMGDALATILSDSLRQNRHLKALWWDRNGITISGWQSLLNVMTNNTTLSHCPHPSFDIDKTIKESKSKEQTKERVRVIMDNIQNALKKNNGGANYTSVYDKVKPRVYNVTASLLVGSDGNIEQPTVYSQPTARASNAYGYGDSYPTQQVYGSDSYYSPPPPPPMDAYDSYGASNDSAPPPPPPPDPYTNYSYKQNDYPQEYDDTNYDQSYDQSYNGKNEADANYNTYDPNLQYDDHQYEIDNQYTSQSPPPPPPQDLKRGSLPAAPDAPPPPLSRGSLAPPYEESSPPADDGGSPPPPPPPPF